MPGYFGENNDDGVIAVASIPSKSGVFGRNETTEHAAAPGGSGVFGLTVAPGAAGVFGANNSPHHADNHGRGVQGNGPAAGVGGFSEAGFGVIGQSKHNSGVVGTSEHGQGLTVSSDNGVGLFAKGGAFAGVFDGALVVNKGPDPKDPSKRPSDINGSIVINDGHLFVNKGDVILTGADCAEEFDVTGSEAVAAGTVMTIDSAGSLRPSDCAYDRRVAGIVSGAGDFRPALVLDRQPPGRNRSALALVGKAYCKVDASHGPIDVGDLLTTSPTPGHAMRADDPARAFGTVIGKALRPWHDGCGLIPVLIALQ